MKKKVHMKRNQSLSILISMTIAQAYIPLITQQFGNFGSRLQTNMRRLVSNATGVCQHWSHPGGSGQPSVATPEPCVVTGQLLQLVVA